MKNLHAIKITWNGPTDTDGASVRLFSERFTDDYLDIPYDYEADTIADMAIDWLESNDYELVGKAETHDGYMILTTTFSRLTI